LELQIGIEFIKVAGRVPAGLPLRQCAFGGAEALVFDEGGDPGPFLLTRLCMALTLEAVQGAEGGLRGLSRTLPVQSRVFI